MVTLEEFVDSIEDPAIFELRGINLFKIFYNQVWVNTRKKPETSPKISQPFIVKFLNGLVVLIKGLSSVIYWGVKSRFVPLTVFFGAYGRNVQIDDITYDLYNYRIVESIGREKVVILEGKEDGIQKRYQADFYFSDFRLLIRVCMLGLGVIWKQTLKRYARKIQQCYPGFVFSEDEIILSVTRFFTHYYVSRLLIALLTPERVILICYYGKEYFVAASKKRGVPVCELMHGLILKTHPHYNLLYERKDYLFSEVFLPDRLAVYGDYWRRIVIQGGIFHKSQIDVIGYYLKLPDNSALPSEEKSKNVILVSTQPIAQDELFNYIDFLKRNLDREQWHVIVKPHPAEESAFYADLAEPGFISLSNKSVYELLSDCDVHISVCSTVLYEATRYKNVRNYALITKDYSDFSNEIVNSGVALPLALNEVPVKGQNFEELLDNYYFAKYDPLVFKRCI